MSKHWRPLTDDGERRSWFGADQTRPELPHYLRSGKRLRGLDEFQTPAFVGRMARVARRRKLAWQAMLLAAIVTGLGIGWWLI